MDKIQFPWNRWRWSRRGSVRPPLRALTVCAGITTATTLLFMSAGMGQPKAGPASTVIQQRDRSPSASAKDATNFQVDSNAVQVEAVDPPVETDSQRRASQDDKLRVLLAGEWQQHYYGKRCLTVRTDGTATMVIEPEGIWVHLFGARLQAEIEWTLDNGRVKLQIIGGTPSEKIELASKMWGECWTQPILELTENRLLLLGEDGVTKYDWTRVSESRG